MMRYDMLELLILILTILAYQSTRANVIDLLPSYNVENTVGYGHVVVIEGIHLAIAHLNSHISIYSESELGVYDYSSQNPVILTPTGYNAGSGNLGTSLAMNNQGTIFIGASTMNGKTIGDGCVYIFTSSSQTATDWQQLERWTAVDGSIGDAYGSDIAVHDLTVAVLSEYNTHKVYLYTESSVNAFDWQENVQYITAAHNGTAIDSASSLDMLASLLVLGCEEMEEAYVFIPTGTATGTYTNHTAVKLTKPSALEEDTGQTALFGSSVTLHTELLLCVSAIGYDNGAGLVAIYTLPSLNADWNIVIPSVLTALAGSSFGHSVACNDIYLYITAPYANEDAGLVYKYDWATLTEEIIAPDNINNNNGKFGYAIAVRDNDDDNNVIISSVDELVQVYTLCSTVNRYSPCQCTENENNFGQNCDLTCLSGQVVSSGATLHGFTYSDLCVCDVGWTGIACDEDIDECASSPCVNDGICTDLLGDFTCECELSLHTGKTCADDVSWLWNTTLSSINEVCTTCTVHIELTFHDFINTTHTPSSFEILLPLLLEADDVISNSSMPSVIVNEVIISAADGWTTMDAYEADVWFTNVLGLNSAYLQKALENPDGAVMTSVTHLQVSVVDMNVGSNEVLDAKMNVTQVITTTTLGILFILVVAYWYVRKTISSERDEYVPPEELTMPK